MSTSGTNPGPVTILSISEVAEEHAALESLLRDPRWKLLRAGNLTAAGALLSDTEVAVVVCDCDSVPEDWATVVKHVQTMPLPASVIITSRIADDRLWSQALHLGAWDVLAKPFRAAEVLRSVRYAWEHWRNQNRASGRLEGAERHGVLAAQF